MAGFAPISVVPPKLDVGFSSLREQDLASSGSARLLEAAVGGRHHEGPWTAAELTQDDVNDLLGGDERDAGWDADEEYERVR
jgi:hypothetical protein